MTTRTSWREQRHLVRRPEHACARAELRDDRLGARAGDEHLLRARLLDPRRAARRVRRRTATRNRASQPVAASSARPETSAVATRLARRASAAIASTRIDDAWLLAAARGSRGTRRERAERAARIAHQRARAGDRDARGGEARRDLEAVERGIDDQHRACFARELRAHPVDEPLGDRPRRARTCCSRRTGAATTTRIARANLGGLASGRRVRTASRVEHRRDRRRRRGAPPRRARAPTGSARAAACRA